MEYTVTCNTWKMGQFDVASSGGGGIVQPLTGYKGGSGGGGIILPLKLFNGGGGIIQPGECRFFGTTGDGQMLRIGH